LPGSFRTELREFLRAADGGRPPKDPISRLAWQRAWCARLADGGWAGPTWPRSCGGLELDISEQLIYAEELARARVPSHPGTGFLIAGPTIIRHGTDEQRARWLPGLLRADLIWAQAFSEPDAGSDLPALTTRAVRDGDEYIVSGRKVWSSWASQANGLFALVRTGGAGSAEKGITYLVVDSLTAGVSIRPIRDMTGGSEFSEIVFDDVRVPVRNRVGPEGGGWVIARTSLGHERIALAVVQARFYRRIMDELIDLARRQNVAADPVWRQRLMAVETDVRLMQYAGARALAALTRSGDPGPGSSTSRLLNSQAEQRLHEVAVDLLGASGLLHHDDPDAIEKGRWTRGFLRTRASTIGAGTAEIQRNTIAEKVLGLPREGLPREGLPREGLPRDGLTDGYLAMG
jgi:alkylation response protein AidB-like acyl-CoA dehydrogenase